MAGRNAYIHQGRYIHQVERHVSVHSKFPRDLTKASRKKDIQREREGMKNLL